MRTVTKSNAESVMKRYCLFCNKELEGRPDKKFCNYNCRNTYNNKTLKRIDQAQNQKNLSLIPINTNLNYMTNSSSATIKVAFADDHSMIRECLYECLTLWGYSVIIQAFNGRNLLDQISQENMPDICILDINMPELDGYETIKILNKSWPRIKIMVFSMSIVKGINDKVAGAHAVVSKADGMDKIKGTLESLTDLKAVLH
jgi:CheY-like chemotaxis protein